MRISRVHLAIVFSCINCGIISCRGNNQKLVIDNDAGSDDAMGIFLALLYEKNFNGPEVVALTTCNGNAKEENVYVNNQKVLKIAGRQDIPIYRGAKQSLITELPRDVFFGEDGLGDTGEIFTGLVEAREENAVSALIQLSKVHQGRLTVVTLGALTNIATALVLDPDFLNRIHRLYVASGSIYEKSNISDPVTNFNSLMDVESFRILLNHAKSDKVTLLPFTVIEEPPITRAWRVNALGTIPTYIMQQLNKFERVSIPTDTEWKLQDPATVAVFLNPNLVNKCSYSLSNITICGEERGLITNSFVKRSEGNTKTIKSINIEDYKQFLLDVFSEK